LVIEIHLHTILQRNTESGTIRKINLELPSDSTLAEVLAILDIQLPIDYLLFVVNGNSAELEQRLLDGDIVHIIPILSGG
jgi:molybdopterin converting factor small subunit